jgi:hypothetical protein
VASQVVAGEGVKDAAAQEGGADQDVENVKHGDFPRSATKSPHAAWHVALHTDSGRTLSPMPPEPPRSAIILSLQRQA